MAIDYNKLIETVLTGLLTGGTSAITTFFAAVRDLKKRLTTLEERLGTLEPRTGVYVHLGTLEETVKKLKKEVESWEDAPPTWAVRLVSKQRNSSADLGGLVALEDRITSQFRQFQSHLSHVEQDLADRCRRLDETIKKLENDLKKIEVNVEKLEEIIEVRLDKVIDNRLEGRVITRSEFEKDSKTRAEEMLQVREQVATANGLLRGVMTALGFVDQDRKRT